MYFRTIGTKAQTELLLDHFRVNPSISGMEAAAMLKIKSLPRRILDLEARGHRFTRVVKADSTGQRYTRYFYLGRDPNVDARELAA